MTEPTIKLLLTDDQALMRQGLQLIFDLEADIKVVGDVSSGEEALTFIAENAVDVVLMDVRMSGMGGIRATQKIRQQYPETRVIILTTFEDEEYLFDGLIAGASGYLLKDSSSERLLMAVRAVARGEGFLQPEAASKVVAAYTQLVNAPKRRDQANQSLAMPLTERELEILTYLDTGASNREIATALFLSEGTVKNYVTSILSKLDARDRNQATQRAKDIGLI
ncbi:MAG: response regulator transcription factor [Chloroflexota bacterium]